MKNFGWKILIALTLLLVIGATGLYRCANTGSGTEEF